MRRLIVSIWFACTAQMAGAIDMPDYLANTPVGSWVTSEDRIQRGRKTEAMRITRSLVGEEMIEGKRFLWVEIKTETFKVSKKGKLKQKGDTAFIKMLSDASLFSGNASDLMGNFKNLAKKMYIKTGDHVMDMSAGGMFADAMLKGMGTSMSFDMTDLDESRQIETPLGTVTAHRYKGVGDAEVKVIIKTVKTHTESDMWLSSEVPFGMVEMQSNTTINGKTETASSNIIAAGLSGAKSEVDISKAQANPLSALKFGKP